MIMKLYEERAYDAVDQLIDRHGLGRVVLAVMTALVQKRRDEVNYVDQLSDHLRRDIGLDKGRSDPWQRR